MELLIDCQQGILKMELLLMKLISFLIRIMMRERMSGCQELKSKRILRGK